MQQGEAFFIPAKTQVRVEVAPETTIYRAWSLTLELILMESSTSLQFRGQTPECLKFGTSGLRGKVDAMTDLEVYINTTGFLEYLLGMHAIQAGDPVCLGGIFARAPMETSEASCVRSPRPWKIWAW